jgi:hypothetical protein
MSALPPKADIAKRTMNWSARSLGAPMLEVIRGTEMYFAIASD